jgi:hypothetical protein
MSERIDGLVAQAQDALGSMLPADTDRYRHGERTVLRSLADAVLEEAAKACEAWARGQAEMAGEKDADSPASAEAHRQEAEVGFRYAGAVRAMKGAR